ncbi:carboxylesterase family protein [Saccharothrix xinjiangensis]
MDAFLGIRYAEPPFGARRFAEPDPVDPAGPPVDCLGFGPLAPQAALLPGTPLWRPGHEDVLTLNIWAPPPAPEPRPVLLFLHGGAYTFGSSAQPDFDGAALARAGLVVVTCNYRVGFEGFGHVPGRPDNRGLLDQRAALRWVRAGIEVFGGDPDNITVAGHSAGATSALFLAAAEPVRRVIAHSPPNRVHTPGFARGVAEWVDTTTPESTVLSAARLAKAQRTGPLSHDPVLFGPVADRLPTVPPHVDLLLAHTDVEYRLFEELGSFRVARTAAELLRFGRDWGIPDHVVTAYREFPDAHTLLAGDFLFVEPTNRAFETHPRAHLARFTRPPAWHNADLPFCFGNLRGADFLIGGAPGPDEHALARRVLASWVAFCTTGDPGWTGVHHWGPVVEPRRAPWRGVPLDPTFGHLPIPPT